MADKCQKCREVEVEHWDRDMAWHVPGGLVLCYACRSEVWAEEDRRRLGAGLPVPDASPALPDPSTSLGS